MRRSNTSGHGSPLVHTGSRGGVAGASQLPPPSPVQRPPNQSNRSAVGDPSSPYQINNNNSITSDGSSSAENLHRLRLQWVQASYLAALREHQLPDALDLAAMALNERSAVERGDFALTLMAVLQRGVVGLGPLAQNPYYQPHRRTTNARFAVSGSQGDDDTAASNIGDDGDDAIDALFPVFDDLPLDEDMEGDESASVDDVSGDSHTSIAAIRRAMQRANSDSISSAVATPVTHGLPFAPPPPSSTLPSYHLSSLSNGGKPPVPEPLTGLARVPSIDAMEQSAQPPRSALATASAAVAKHSPLGHSVIRVDDDDGFNGTTTDATESQPPPLGAASASTAIFRRTSAPTTTAEMAVVVEKKPSALPVTHTTASLILSPSAARGTTVAPHGGAPTTVVLPPSVVVAAAAGDGGGADPSAAAEPATVDAARRLESAASIPCAPLSTVVAAPANPPQPVEPSPSGAAPSQAGGKRAQRGVGRVRLAEISSVAIESTRRGWEKIREIAFNYSSAEGSRKNTDGKRDAAKAAGTTETPPPEPVVLSLSRLESSLNSGITSDTTESIVLSEASTSVDDAGFETIGNKYVVLHDLGAGTQAVVKLAVNQITGEHRAIKVIKKDNKPGLNGKVRREQQLRELAVAKEIRHAHIVQIYEVISPAEGDNVFIVMQLAEHGPVGRLRDDGTCATRPVSLLIRWLYQCTQALRCIHALGVVHRDIKPDNLLLDKFDNVVITDFGVSARLSDSDRINCRPETIDQLGSGAQAFRAPEEYTLPFEETGSAVDIWSLGVTFFALTFGRLPFHAQTYADLRTAICSHEPDFEPGAAPVLDPNALSQWESVLKVMLRRKVENRWTAKRLRDYLKRHYPSETARRTTGD